MLDHSASTSIVFARHAEKPSDSGKPHGINHDGVPDPHSLSVRGWTRAGALASMFGLLPQARYPGVNRPAAIYATEPSHQAKSTREFDTAHPTAKALGVTINCNYKHGEESALAEELQTSVQNSFVVWHHGALPALLGNFSIHNASDIPSKWPEDRFDLLWVLTRIPGSASYMWSEVNQSLLDGDVG